MNENEQKKEYVNFYKCSCGYRWKEIWNCNCNDKCPVCDTEIEPYAYEEID